MNKQQIRSFVMRYLEALHCSVIEKTESFITVKLSPEADKELTQRSYYWSFVERTGVTPETMTFTFVFDPEQEKTEARLGPRQPNAQVMQPQATAGAGGQTGSGITGTGDSILGRYFGFVPTSVVSRVPRDELTYGSRRLEQIFQSVKAKGKFVNLFEEPYTDQGRAISPLAYETWLNVNYKVELACDMKRSEIHSLAIQLTSGDIVDQFHEQMLPKKLSPKIPADIHLPRDSMTLKQAVSQLEMCLEDKIKPYDHRWADDANDRLNDELARVEGYYGGLLQSVEPDKRPEVLVQFDNRKREIDWQYRPRILVSVINCGLFHLNVGVPSPYDASR